jgi:hypothetical protein
LFLLHHDKSQPDFDDVRNYPAAEQSDGFGLFIAEHLYI